MEWIYVENAINIIDLRLVAIKLVDDKCDKFEHIIEIINVIL